MNYKKIIALMSALCIMGGTLQTLQSRNIINTAYAEEDSSNTLNFTAIGQTIPIKLTNNDNLTVTWKSDNENVATVDQNGNITSTGVGSCNVYAITSSQVLSLKVIVTEESAETPDEPVTVTLDEIHLDHAQNTAVPSFNGADTSAAQWSSSDTNVATVDENGNIEA